MNTDYLKLVETALFDYLPDLNCNESKLIEAMKYSLEAGGKRVRPRLVYEFNSICSGEANTATPFACAVEMIHTYSLIHDDLPSMDDDDLRRGKPSNHKVFGEDIALLAGDALLTMAFDVLTNKNTVELAGYEACCKATNILAKYAGATGMVGGQVIDLLSENTNAPIEIIEEIDYKKTACLIKAACEMGCVSANAVEKQIKAASQYGECIGLAFQIQDDILDVTSSNEVLGKPVGSDKENCKSTYVSLLGIEKCKSLVAELTDKAIKALDEFKGNTESLKTFAQELACRNK